MVALRPMTVADLSAVQPLLEQLGYALTLDEIASRFGHVTAAPDHQVIVAELDGRIVGLIHFYPRAALEARLEVIVEALVVDRTLRRSGVGAALMEAAEQWARPRDVGSVALSSNVVRHDAHAFYTARGYQMTTTSHRFRKIF